MKTWEMLSLRTWQLTRKFKRYEESWTKSSAMLRR